MEHIEPPPTWGATLDRWFARLDTEKFRTGVRERLLAQSLLSRLAARGELPATQKEMLALVAPLLCTTREQQRRYDIVLDDFVGGGGRRSGEEEGTGGGGANDDARRGPVPARHLVALIALVVVVAAALWWATRPAPVIDPDPKKDTGTTSVADAASGAAATASAPPRAFYVPPLPLPLQPSLPPAWSAPLRASLVGLGGVALAALLAAAWARRRREMALQGVLAGDEVEHHLLHDATPVDVAPHPMLARAVARALRQRVAGEARVMDVAATLRATAAARGAFSPRWRELRRTPEYLVLVDTRAAADHHAAYALTLVQSLKAAGVSVQVHRYDTTPASGCWASGAVGNDDAATRQKVPLALLATRSAHHRLLVFGPADAVLHPVSGEAQPWLASLRLLAERAWFTPQPIHAWGPAEQAADEAGFLVLPLQEAALPTLAGWLTSERLTLALDADSPQTYPALLRGSGLDWVSRADAPPADALEALLQQLRAMLGGERFQWLCACAVFPALTPPLTLALGDRVLTGTGAAPGEAADSPAAHPRALALGLAALSALPWFRYGRMPAWLRRELLQRLAPDLRQQLELEVRARLDAAMDAGEGPVLADVATRRRRLLAALQRRHGPLRDVVLADFIRRGSETGLMQRLPEGLRRRLFKDGDPGAGWRTGIVVAQGIVVALALFAVTPLWQAAVGTTAQPALVRLADGPGFINPPNRFDTGDQFFVSRGETSIGLRVLNSTRVARFFADGDAALVGSNDYFAKSEAEEHNLGSALPMPQSNADGLTLDLSSSRLQLRNPAGDPVGAPLDTGGLAARAAAFTPSGSRVVAMLEDGRLRSWGREWPKMTVDVVGCDGADPATGVAGDVARAFAATRVPGIEATAYTQSAWDALPDRTGTLLAKSIGVLPAGRVAFGSAVKAAARSDAGLGDELDRLPETLRALGLPATTTTTMLEEALPADRVAVGACTASETSNPIDAPPAIEGLSPAEQSALLQRVDLMFAADADTRKAATASLLTDREHYSDAVPLAIWRALRSQASRAQGTPASTSGVINVLVLLQSASAATLYRERDTIDRLFEAVNRNGPQTQEQIARVQTRRDAAAKSKPLISTQIAGEFQRALAVRLSENLALRNIAVAGVEVVGDRAPANPQLRVQGLSDRLTARRLRDAVQVSLERPVAMVSVAETRGGQDTYEIWIDRAACDARTVVGCRIAAAASAAQLPGAVIGPSSAALSGVLPQARVAAKAASSSAQTSASGAPDSTAAAASTGAVSSLPPLPPWYYAPTPQGLELVARFEGFRPEAVTNGAARVIGYGHTLTPEELKTGEIDLRGGRVPWAKGLTEAQARRLLQIDLQRPAEYVNTRVKVSLTRYQRDVLVSFVHNVGLENWSRSTVLTRLNSGDYVGVPEELSRWSAAGGTTYPGLQARREAEAELWRTAPPAGK